MEFAEAIEKPRVNDVVLKKGDEKTNGSLAITSHHLIFQPSSPGIKAEELWVRELHLLSFHCVHCFLLCF